MKYLDFTGLSLFLEQLKKKFAPIIHQHNASDIIETDSKKMVSTTQINRWNDTYTKSETDVKLGNIVTGLDWKAAVETFDDIATTYTDPEDGWTVSVKDTNHIYRYDEETSSWVDIGQSLDIPLASSEDNGLLKKEDYDKLQSLPEDLESKLGKEENAISASKLQTPVNINGIAFDGTESISITSDNISQGSSNLFCTSTEKENWSNKYTTQQIDSKVTEINETITTTKEEIVEMIEPATLEEIENLFQ